MKQCKIRIASEGDYDELGEVMYDAVRTGDSQYTKEQRAAWVPCPRKGADWTARLSAQTIYVAAAEGSILGFMSLAENAYLDFAYIRPRAQGCGIFRALYNEIERTAVDAKLPRIWVHASLKAKPAFLAVGFAVTSSEQVSIGNVWLDRFEMEKHLTR